MNIAFISQYHPLETLGGGILRATMSKVEGLAELGNQVTLFCLGDENRKYVTSGGYTIVEIKSWTWKRDKLTKKALLDRFMSPDFKTRSFLIKALREINPNYLITTTEGSIAKISLSFSRQNNKKIYFYPHVILSKIEQFVPKENKVGRFLAKQQLVPSTLKFINKCSGIVAINEASQNDLLKLKVKVPIKLVPNSVNYELFSETQKSLLENPVLTYVGLISERKNQKYLLNVIEKLPFKAKLVLIGGDFDSEYSSEIKEYIKKTNLDVEIISKASQSVIAQVLANTSVFVSASLLEVQSLSVLEAISSGTPVVMLENETVSDFANVNGVTVLSQNEDPKVFATEVLKFIKMSKEEYLQLSLELKLFAKKFSKLETAEILIRELSTD